MQDSVSEKALLLFYDLCWRLALPVLRINKRLKEGYDQRTLRQKNISSAEIWIQAASAGESFLAWSLLKKLQPDRPIRIMLTTNTSQGMDILTRAVDDVRQNNPAISASTAYFPFDKPAIMAEAVRFIQPKVMVFLELEMWPGLLFVLKKFGCKTLIINGRMAEKSLKGYLAFPSLWRVLRPDNILALSQDDARRFTTLFGGENIDVMHNIKFDRIDPAEIHSGAENPVKKIVPSDMSFVVLGSVRQEEEPLIEKIIDRVRRQQPETIMGLFPRHMHRIRYWQKILERHSIPFTLRSETTTQVSPGTVILWDTFGELALAYEAAKATFVGGTLEPVGGQNFLEPLIYGIPPVIGPYWESFSWVGRKIINQGLVREANNWQEVADILLQDLKKPPSYGRIRETAQKYIKAHQGGTDKACDLIRKCLRDG